jgi:hypothetical protein
MTYMIFTVSEEPIGWFVQGHDKIGPFFSKQTALDLAEGMVSALRAAGEDADMCIAPRPTPGLLAPEGRSFSNKDRPERAGQPGAGGLAGEATPDAPALTPGAPSAA